MKKVLICMPSFTIANGVAKFIMNSYKDLIDNGYDIDFLVLKNEEQENEEYLKKVNKYSIVYEIRETNKIIKFFKVYRLVKKIQKNKRYDAIHINIIGVPALAVLLSAKNVKKRIYHMHNPINNDNKIKYFMRYIVNKLCVDLSNVYFASSNETAKNTLKNKEYTIVPNAIDVKKYAYSIQKRDKIRKQFGIESNEIVIGTIGRLEEQKNCLFTIEVVNNLMQRNKKVKYISIGSGSLKSNIIEIVKKSENKNKYIILDNQVNVEEFYSAMDIFLLPSRYEGLGIVFIEAQASGLTVITSDKVPDDIKVTNLINNISLSKSEIEWAIEVNKIIRNIKKYDRKEYNKILLNSAYNINSIESKLTKFYDENL